MKITKKLRKHNDPLCYLSRDPLSSYFEKDISSISHTVKISIITMITIYDKFYFNDKIYIGGIPIIKNVASNQNEVNSEIL